MALYFENTKTGKRFKVLSWDETTGEIRLKGEAHEFTETFSKKRFKEMNYKPVEIPDETPAEAPDDPEDDEE